MSPAPTLLKRRLLRAQALMPRGGFADRFRDAYVSDAAQQIGAAMKGLKR